MANLNKVMLIGRLTRDVETREFAGGGKVANFGFCVNNKRKNAQTGQYEEDPCFIDCKVFNSGSRKLADLVEQYLHKGSMCYLEGKLTYETWEKDGQKRSVVKVIVDDFQFLDSTSPRSQESDRRPAPKTGTPPPVNAAPEEDIPF